MKVGNKNLDFNKAFSLIELLVVISIISILASILLPVLSKFKARGRQVICLNNNRQLNITWFLYSDDNNQDLVANGLALVNGSVTDFGGVETNKSWCQGPFVERVNQTNESLILDNKYALFANYIKEKRIYKCPEDKSDYLRSYQLNWWAGKSEYPQYFGTLFYPTEVRFLPLGKQNEIKDPTKLFLFLDVYNKSICWNFFGFYLTRDAIANYPANYHDGTVVSFADGHIEKHKWQDFRTKKTEDSNYHNHFDNTPENKDLNWIKEFGLGGW